MNLIQESIFLLEDAEYFLQRISSEEYSKSIELMSDSTIGQHTRHFIEFYQCLLDQADSKNINYCLRKRDQLIEQNPQAANKAINNIKERLTDLDFEKEVTLFTAKENGNRVKSTIGRELYYNIEHCIHHLALIKIGLLIIQPNLTLPSHFGFAPSTIQHRKLGVQS